jgi:hypothetical protein
MNAEEQRIAKRKLRQPLLAGVIITTAGLAFFEFGSKKPTPQTISLFVTVFGLILFGMAVMKLRQLRKFIADQNKGKG